jgi:gliding motility-associated protein GldM
MAGGKETPRQKMVGMMYLVLTALLALNVSKSILDAFVAIEENTQKSAVTQLDRGNGYVSALKQGITENKEQAPQKAAKCMYYLGVIEKIDKKTGEIIEFIDQVKLNILKESGEIITTEKNNDKETIIWKKYNSKDPLRPTRMNLMAVQAKDQYDVPMHEIIGEEINNPAPEKYGMKLWKMYNDYRAFIVESTGTLHDKIDSASGKGIGNTAHTVKTYPINKFNDNKDLDKQVTDMLYKSNIYDKDKGNIKKNDDFDLLKQLYMELTKQERYDEVNDVKNVHWIGKTFDHSPLVAALASLTAMQLEILNARATAAGALAEKVVVAELSFNKLIALASISPSVANPGDPVELRVVMGAYDTDNMPDMGESGWTIENGMAIKKISAPSADQTYTGTISIKAKSGAIKKENWETKIGVLTNEKEASIETPEMQVFYEGIPIELKASATGMYKNVRMSVGSPYTAPVGTAGQVVQVSLTGTDSKGSTVNLGVKKFTVKKAPKPELVWNGKLDGEMAVRSSGALMVRYNNSVPFNPGKGKFSISQYYIIFPGGKTPLVGSGSTISAAHLNAIKSASGGVSIQVSVGGSYNGLVTATFK